MNYHPSSTSHFDLSFASTLQLMVPLVTQSRLLLSPNSGVSQAFIEAMLMIQTKELSTVSLMNQLLLNALRCRNETALTFIPLMISKNGRFEISF